MARGRNVGRQLRVDLAMRGNDGRMRCGRVHCPQLLMGYHTTDELEDAAKDVTLHNSSSATDDLADAVGGARG